MGAPLANGGRVKHINGTATGVAAAIELQATESARLDIFNADAGGGDNLLISFDDGATFFTLTPQTYLSGPFATKTLTMKSSGAATLYQILWTTVV